MLLWKCCTQYASKFGKLSSGHRTGKGQFSFQSQWMWSESESEVAQSCPTLCDPMDCSLSGSSVHGIFEARVLEWIAISFSRGSSRPRNQTWVSRIAGRCFTIWATREGPKERQCQRVFKLPHNCTPLIHQQSNAQNSPCQASTVCELWTSRCSIWI